MFICGCIDVGEGLRDLSYTVIQTDAALAWAPNRFDAKTIRNNTFNLDDSFYVSFRTSKGSGFDSRVFPLSVQGSFNYLRHAQYDLNME